MPHTEPQDALALTPERPLREADYAAWDDRTLPLDVHVAASDLEQVPTEGACVVVCNCPYGGLEPKLVRELLHNVRSDVRLALAPDAATVSNWLADGSCVVLFPGAAGNQDWDPLAATLARAARCEVVPLHLPDRSVEIDKALGGGSPARIEIRIGRRMGTKRIQQLDPSELTSNLRLRTMLLGARPAAAAETATQRGASDGAPVVAPEPVEQLEAEIAALPAARLLMESGSTRVFYATADEIPHLLREIGRLREETFRLVGEGTGNEIDLDHYDPYYEHLFSWDTEQRRMVGAYRLGRIDTIMATRGVEGLYTQSLFQLQPELFAQLGPALELGRSFIIPAHQKDFMALYALWCGIGRYIVRHPRYQKLFGAVSISNDYASLTRQLLMEFLQANELDRDLSRHVIPRNPPQFRPVPRDTQALLSTGVRRIEEVEELVRDLESDRRGVPILLRQYLRLNGTLLAFNIDPDFGDVLDGLMLIDVTRIEPKMFRRFLGLRHPDELRALARDADGI